MACGFRHHRIEQLLEDGLGTLTEPTDHERADSSLVSRSFQ
jgi:hypothetical protein